MKQALLSWTLMYSHNFSPHKCTIWNNKYIRIRNKSIFFENWFEKGIIWVKQLIKKDGVLYNYTEFVHIHNFLVDPIQYCLVLQAIPKEILRLLEGSNNYSLQTTEEFTSCIMLQGKDFTSFGCNNIFLRSLLQSKSILAVTRLNSLFKKNVLIGVKFG